MPLPKTYKDVEVWFKKHKKELKDEDLYYEDQTI